MNTVCVSLTCMLPCASRLRVRHRAVAAARVAAAPTDYTSLPAPPTLLQWTPDGLNVMTGSASGSMAIWSGSVFTFQLLRRLCSRALRVLRWSHNGEWLLSADDTGEVLYWEKGNSRQQGFPAHRDVVRAISFSPTGEFAVIAS